MSAAGKTPHPKPSRKPAARTTAARKRQPSPQARKSKAKPSPSTAMSSGPARHEPRNPARAPAPSSKATSQREPPADNVVLAAVLEEYAKQLERERANPYRVRAYRSAAKSIGRHPRSLSHMVEAGQDLTTIPNVGPHLESLLVEILETGKVPKLKRDKERKHHEGEEPKASRAGRTRHGTFIRPLLAPFVDVLLEDLRRVPGVEAVEAAGAYRRRADLVEDLDLVAVSGSPTKALRAWTKDLALPSQTDGAGTTLRMTTADKLPVTVRFVTPARLGWTMLEATGTKAHVDQLRSLAWDRDPDWPRPGATEEDCYGALRLPFVPPELREGDGEVEAAKAGKLPRLVRLEDLQGDLHMHTNATDGAASIEVMAKASRARGMSYIAITDHTQRTSIAGGLTPEEMRKHLRRIDQVNDLAKSDKWGITILKGAEVDILRHGLDLPDDVLDDLDIVVCSLHHRDQQEGPELTRRTLEAMDHPKAHILGHPTGRMLGRRPPMDLDWQKVLDHAVDHGWALEVDGQAYRMDPPHAIIRRAAAMGIPFSLDSDAHSVREMQFQENAVEQARRGWLTKDQVLNAGTLKQMKARLRKG